MSSIKSTTCPNCKQSVFPNPDGACPSCNYQIVNNEIHQKSDPLSLKELTIALSTFVRTYEAMFSSTGDIDYLTCDLETARKAFFKWQKEINKQKEQISAIRRLWPDGVQFVDKLDELINTENELIDTWTRWRELLNSRFNINKEIFLEKKNALVIKNRNLPGRIEDLFNAANELLQSAIGFDMTDYYLFEHPDYSKLDLSPDGLTRTMRYIDRVQDVRNEYMEQLLLFLKHHNQANSSPKLLRDNRWVMVGQFMIVRLMQISIGDLSGDGSLSDLHSVPGCLGINLGLLNIKDLTEQLQNDYKNFFDRKDSHGLKKVSILLDKIEDEMANLSKDLEKTIHQIASSARQ